jgi:hypothetical protein
MTTTSADRSHVHPNGGALRRSVDQPERTSSEDGRIEFLVQRDGRDAATAWVERTLGIYRQALSDHRNYALLPQYRPLFGDSIRTFDSWLRNSVPHENRCPRIGRGPEVCVTAGSNGSAASADNSPRSAAAASRVTLVSDGKQLEISGPKSLGASEPLELDALLSSEMHR